MTSFPFVDIDITKIASNQGRAIQKHQLQWLARKRKPCWAPLPRRDCGNAERLEEWHGWPSILEPLLLESSILENPKYFQMKHVCCHFNYFKLIHQGRESGCWTQAKRPIFICGTASYSWDCEAYVLSHHALLIFYKLSHQDSSLPPWKHTFHTSVINRCIFILQAQK